MLIQSADLGPRPPTGSYIMSRYSGQLGCAKNSLCELCCAGRHPSASSRAQGQGILLSRHLCQWQAESTPGRLRSEVNVWLSRRQLCDYLCCATCKSHFRLFQQACSRGQSGRCTKHHQKNLPYLAKHFILTSKRRHNSQNVLPISIVCSLLILPPLVSAYYLHLQIGTTLHFKGQRKLYAPIIFLGVQAFGKTPNPGHGQIDA